LVKSYSHRLTEEQKLDQLEKIQSSVQHMVTLLEDVLTISRADSGKLKFEPAQLNLELFCEHLVDDMQLMTGETHRIVFSAAGGCADLFMDGQLLRQIFSNLLSNAIKYSPRGSAIHFDIRCDEQQVIFRLQDEGIGIPPEDQKHIFESFFRAKNAGNIIGTGLGLTIAKRAAELHGGTIAFESLAGFGTTFTVTLPRSK
jgi:signal transduction histidine kinase